METSSRLYHCALCRIQCLICSHCDRGQIYCGSDCSQIARKNSIKDAEKRYQNTRRGRMKHALRQQHYRERLKQKVTDQGSLRSSVNALLPSVKIRTDTVKLRPYLTCCCCQKMTSDSIRHDFLKKRPPVKVHFVQQPP